MKVHYFLFIFLALLSFYAKSEISYDNKIGWIAVSTFNSNKGNFVELENLLQNENDCRYDLNHMPRIMFSKEDKDILSLLLTAKASNNFVGFYYSKTSSIPKATGHGLSECEFINVWIK
ncbi:hypothetical protein A1OO_19375 [Enterovibrio norvegicus FF-33]|uniref:hypothetical protein n=1 Tax=Enterovibrio norvegicus TaxID=188144 RepID=UPI000369F189|nr:hypothetical protein [Enterovibrio norvegicus]OEE67900.1 hypothetical protein A1OO_19375 [Enterovibrio norvegicus FF-33]OEE73977.1 hypothetical protein A1OQ_10195 [Enterovibrio norvegicus FF-162]